MPVVTVCPVRPACKVMQATVEHREWSANKATLAFPVMSVKRACEELTANEVMTVCPVCPVRQVSMAQRANAAKMDYPAAPVIVALMVSQGQLVYAEIPDRPVCPVCQAIVHSMDCRDRPVIPASAVMTAFPAYPVYKDVQALKVVKEKREGRLKQFEICTFQTAKAVQLAILVWMACPAKLAILV